MIIIVNGTLGVGKTWLSRWLMENLEHAAQRTHLTSDLLGIEINTESDDFQKIVEFIKQELKL